MPMWPVDNRPVLLAELHLHHSPRSAFAQTTPAGAAAKFQAKEAGAGTEFVPGTILAGRYRIVARIGRGGMGEVYRADDLRLGQAVALKFLPPAISRDPASLARVNHEVSIARQIAHPNVCRVFDVAESGHGPFITMEFIDGSIKYDG